MIYILIYVIGIIATLWVIYRSMDSGDEFTLIEFLIFCVFSWLAFIIVIMLKYGDKTVFKKK